MSLVAKGLEGIVAKKSAATAAAFRISLIFCTQDLHPRAASGKRHNMKTK
jgi:hypothetical protein